MLIPSWIATALVVVVCAGSAWLLHRQGRQLRLAQQELLGLSGQIQQSQQQMSESQRQLQKQMERLAGDIIQQAVYRQDGSKHLSAINAVRAGQLDQDLIRQHGLSSDAAALLIALHTDAQGNVTASQAR